MKTTDYVSRGASSGCAFLVAFLSLANTCPAGTEGAAELRISAQVEWNSSTAWSAEGQNPDGTAYQMGISGSDSVRMANDRAYSPGWGWFRGRFQ
jgi:hypothetical protein